jgi:hypothetical protein
VKVLSSRLTERAGYRRIADSFLPGEDNTETIPLCLKCPLIGNLEVLPSQACCACLSMCRCCAGYFVGKQEDALVVVNLRLADVLQLSGLLAVT